MLSGLASLLSVSFVNGQDPLADFLIENRLNRLLLTHREVQADRGLPDRNTAIEQLQQSYARELFRQVDDSPWTQKVLAKAKSSLATNPNRKSERLRLAVSHREVELLRRDYLNGEKFAVAEVDRVIEEVTLIQRGVKQRVENLDRLTELKQTEIGDQSRLNQLRQLQRHGEYLLGWSYFLKSAAGGHPSKPVLRDAESFFRSFLGLDPHANLTKVPAIQFGNQNRFQWMATAGLAAVMRGIGSHEQADHCFQTALENARHGINAERETETINQLKFAGYLHGGDRTQAAQTLDENPKLLRNKKLTGAILKQSTTADELVEKAITGLALNLNVNRLREAFDAFPNVFFQNDVLGPWIRGYLALDEYQENEEPTSLKLAVRELGEATKRLDPNMPAEIRGHCRFLIGSCLYLNQDYQDAAKEFLRSSKLLTSTDQDLAAEAAYRALQSVRLIPGDQEAGEKGIANWLVTNFPASPFAKLANFDLELVRLDNLSNQEAVDHLITLRQNEPAIIVRSAISSELARRYSLLPNLPIQTLRDYAQRIQIDDRVSDDTKIQTNYYFVSKLLAQPSPLDFEKEVGDALVKVNELIERSPATGQKKTEATKLLYYQALALRTLQPENHTRAYEHFQHLISLSSSSPWTSASAIEIAKLFENLKDTQNIANHGFRSRMIEVYEYLLKSPKASNEAVVSLQLARLYLTDDRLLEAEELAEHSKQDLLWLPIHAELAEKKNDLRQSAGLWQQVEKQSPAGTDAWLDARLKRLLVLYRFDERAATELLNRTIALHPSMPPNYAARFQKLADQWGAR